MNRLYIAFLRRLPVRPFAADGEVHLLSADEARHLKRVYRFALGASAGFAVLGYLANVIPAYLLPGLFPTVTVNLPLVGRSQLPVAATVRGLLLMVVEIYALVLLNLWAVHETGVATGYLDPRDESARTSGVLGVGLAKKTRAVEKYGIDPFQGLSRRALAAFNLVLRLKGFLATKALKYVLRRVLGRFAVRAVLDIAGLPIYMAINAYSTHTALREARLIIMGGQLIALVALRLPADAARTPADRALLYDTLQYIAVSKRDYHDNHYALTRAVFERYAIEPEASHPVPEDYLARLTAAPDALRRVCVLLLALGFLLDGRLSRREEARIAVLNANGVLVEDAAALREYARAFALGQGVEPLLARYLGARSADERS